MIAHQMCYVSIRFKNDMQLVYSVLYLLINFCFNGSESEGIKMPRGDKEQIMTYPVMLPSNIELEEFNILDIPILSQIHFIKSENIRLSALRDTLLPKLMSGEMLIRNSI